MENAVLVEADALEDALRAWRRSKPMREHNADDLKRSEMVRRHSAIVDMYEAELLGEV